MNGLGHYILNEQGEPQREPDLMTWARWYEGSAEARRVALDNLGARGEVSTVFLGADHNFGQAIDLPILWETMIFGGPLDQEMWRYRSRAEALDGHRWLVKRLQAWNDAPGAPEETR